MYVIRLKRARCATTLALCLLLVSLTECGGQKRRDTSSEKQNGWIFEGWACAPDFEQAGRGLSPADYCDTRRVAKNTYLYFRFDARASEKVIGLNPRAVDLEKSCRDRARREFATNYRAPLRDLLNGATGPDDSSTVYAGDLHWLPALVKEKVVYGCCAMDPETGLCSRRTREFQWKDCLCVGTLKITGGQAGFNLAAERYMFQ